MNDLFYEGGGLRTPMSNGNYIPGNKETHKVSVISVVRWRTHIKILLTIDGGS